MKSLAPSRLVRGLAKALLLSLLMIVSSALADTVKLKSGETLEGRITTEGSDYIKLEVSISATIKDTKIIPRADIAEIIKAAPDDVALGELRKMLPAPSLMAAPAYRKLIDSGPKRFLTDFPSSKHKEEVDKIMAELSAELDKVERGYLKLNGEWISPQDRKQFQALTESRIRGVVFERKLAQRDLLGSLREFEILEERYYGTPAHVAAIGKIKEMLPAFGAQLTRALQDVEYKNQKWEADKTLLNEADRMKVEQARAQEIAAFEQAVEREKEADVKWVTISDTNSDSLSGAIELVKAEIERLGGMDEAGLTAMSEKLVEADQLVAEQKIENAREVIEEATSLVTDAKATSRSRSSRSRSKSSSGAPTTYIAAINLKIQDVEDARELAQKQAEEAAKGAEASSAIKSGDSKPVVEASVGEAAPAEGEMPADGEATEGAGEEKVDQASALSGLMGSGEEEEKEDEEKDSKEKKSSSSRNDEEGADSDDSYEEEEAGFLNFQTIMMGVAGLLVLTVVLMKVLGVGGKKEKSAD